MLWNWRMLLTSGDGRYADVLEQSLYNSVLSGVSLDGNRYFYTNPLRASQDFPYTLRWAGGREEYIALSNCCPPNLARTIAEVADYMYCVNEKGLWLNLYGGNILQTSLAGGEIAVREDTEYPWDGKVVLTVGETPTSAFSMFLRIPGWCHGAGIRVNGQAIAVSPVLGYAEIHRIWKRGDIVTLELPMQAVLVQANPLVEETRNQVAVRLGPVVYCLESPDLGAHQEVANVALSSGVIFQPTPMVMGNSHLMALTGKAFLLPSGDGRLYQELSTSAPVAISVRLIPYYAWANRGASDMSVWIDLLR
jgi:DUF1680 family protein